ncbi:MAG: tRNA pseudouridine(38-40) synthase TruA [Microbacteriaceae bacterium]
MGASKFRLDLAYDGLGFHGWAKQPGLHTVQGILEESLNRILHLTGEDQIFLVVAGRTDVGVHARAQVAHFDLPEMVDQEKFVGTFLPRGASEDSKHDISELFAQKLCVKLNSMFSRAGEIVIQRVRPVDTSFDARFSALSRTYQYLVADALSEKDPLARANTVWLLPELNLELLNAAAAALIGLHDFATFCRPRPEATTIRTLQRFSWSRDAQGVLIAELQADAFCHSMVRALIGGCIAVGEGRLGVDEFVSLHQAAVRTSAFKVMPAKGLTLMGVQYPHSTEWAARDVQTRARRSVE